MTPPGTETSESPLETDLQSTATGAADASSPNLENGSIHGARKPIFYIDITLSPSVDDPRRLVFVAAPGASRIPDGLLRLRQDYTKTARVATALFEDEKNTRQAIFIALHEAADRGFRGPDFDIEDGRANLEEARSIITDYAIKVRDRYLHEYAMLAVVFGVVPLLIGAAIYLTNGFGQFRPQSASGAYDPIFVWTLSVFWIPAGAAICVWGEFALRMQEALSYEQLMNLDPSRWRPGQRLLITVGVAFIFAFLLFFTVVQVGIGGVLLNDFGGKTPAFALAVGGITGFAFAGVRDIIVRMKPTERE